MNRPDKKDYVVHDIAGHAFMDLARYNRALEDYISYVETKLKAVIDGLLKED